MSQPIHVFLLGASVALAACDAGGGGDDDVPCTGKCDAPQTCDDPRYGDGTCETQLECAPPDIDCFVTFDDDDAAAAWFTAWEEIVAGEQGRAPRALVPASDPRFARARDLLDRGWDAFRAHRSVGRLGDRRPALVVIEDPVLQAFVIPDKDTHLSALTVMVHTGLLDLGGDDGEMLGLMMHELQHAVGLHLLGDVADRIRKFYVADDGEPLGRNAPEDPTARDAGTAWRSLAGEVGPQSVEDLGGFPLAGDLRGVFDLVVGQGNANSPAACASSLASINAIADEIKAAKDPIDMSLALAPDIFYRIDDAMARLRDECLAGVDVTLYDVVAVMTGAEPTAVRDAMSPEDRALVDGFHVMDAIWNLTDDRRWRMREIEYGFELDTGFAWDRLRFFSTEEDADDISVPVLDASGFPGASLGGLLYAALPTPDAKARCTAFLDDGGPPYGVDLLDEHHAICWRVHHIDLVAASGPSGARPAPSRAVHPRYAAPRRLGIPRRLGDQVMY